MAGSITLVKNDCFEHDIGRDNRCFKFMQNYDQSYRGRYHSEVLLSNATKIGLTQYFGFVFRVPKNWEFTRSIGSGKQLMHNRVSIAQFITSFKDWDCGRHRKLGVPGVMLWIQDDNFYIRLRTGSVCDDHGANIVEFRVGKIQRGIWHSVVFGGKWSKNKDGWFKVWYDKDLKVDKSRIRTWMDVDDRAFEFRVGIYPNWWTWDGSGHPMIREMISHFIL